MKRQVIPDKQDLLNYYENKTMTEIASLYGVSKMTITNWFKRYCIPVDRGKGTRKPLPAQQEVARLIRTAGYRGAAKVIGISAPALWRRTKNTHLCEYPEIETAQYLQDGMYSTKNPDVLIKYHLMDERTEAKKNLQDSLQHQMDGKFLYHIWEHEWESSAQSKIIDHIKALSGAATVRKLNARKCSVKEASHSQVADFLKQNHLQGTATASVNLMLMHGAEPVAVMTFGRPRFRKDYDWELLRYASKKDTRVRGGASKLFAHFIARHNPEKVLSYSHIHNMRGDMYTALGFKEIGRSSPSYVWVNPETKDVLSRYKCQMKSETEIMQARGYHRVFDCGNRIWDWHK